MDLTNTKQRRNGAPASAAAAGAAAEIKDSLERNQISQGEKPTLPKGPAKPKDVLEGPKPKSKRPQQQELNGMPTLDGVGKAARRMKDAIIALQDATDEKGEAEDALLKALKKARRTAIQCDGFKFQFNHIGPKDKITVQKQK